MKIMNLANFGNLAFSLEYARGGGNCPHGPTNFVGHFLLLGGDS